ncbi:unnamed protein product, partial [Ectocarpus sp. 13 AM-2016]
ATIKPRQPETAPRKRRRRSSSGGHSSHYRSHGGSRVPWCTDSEAFVAQTIRSKPSSLAWHRRASLSRAQFSRGRPQPRLPLVACTAAPVPVFCWTSRTLPCSLFRLTTDRLPLCYILVGICLSFFCGVVRMNAIVYSFAQH